MKDVQYHFKDSRQTTIWFSINSYSYQHYRFKVLLHISVERHLQRKVHLRVCFLQMHCFVLQGVSVLHWHSITLIKTSGAILVPSGVTLGRRMSNPSGEYHPNSVVINWGGSGFRQTFIVAAARWALRTFCLNNTSVGGRDLSFGGSKTFRAIFFSHVLTHTSS